MKIMKIDVVVSRGGVDVYYINPHHLESVQDLGSGECVLELTRSTLRVQMTVGQISAAFEAAMKM